MIAPVFARAPTGAEPPEPLAAWTAALSALRRRIRETGPPPIDDLLRLLEHVPASDRGDAASDLVGVHLAAAWARGPGPRLGGYLGVLGVAAPELLSLEAVPAGLFEDEFLARSRPPHGDAPTSAEYAARLPTRGDVVEMLSRREVSGRYVRLDRLARSPAGEVWLAADRRTRGLVVLKYPAAGVRASPVAELVEPTGHAGLVGALDWGTDGAGHPFVAMRNVEGESLAETIRAVHRGKARDAGLRRLAATIARACEVVAHAHARGIHHGDLKPSHLVAEPGGGVSVLDWNLLPGDGAPSRTSVVLGTPEYMAPEQVSGRCDARSDVFGLGSVLFEAVTGRPPRPWGPVRPPGWAGMVRDLPVPTACAGPTRASRRLIAVCSRAMAHDPGDRYASVASLRDDLRRWLGSRGTGLIGRVLGR